MNGNASLEISGAMQILALGGPVMAILAALSVFGLAIVLLKLWQFTVTGVGRRGGVETALEQWRVGHRQAAVDELDGRGHPAAEVVHDAMRGLRDGLSENQVREEAARRGGRMIADLRGYFRPLELIGSLSPLLGLLGTVLGMIEAFQAMEAAGNQVNAAVLSGGIWEALLTTAAGLSVAIPAVAALNFLERMVERLHEDMQDALTRVFTVPCAATAGAERQETGPQVAASHAH